MARNKKHINDKFYTKFEVVDNLLSVLNLEQYDVIIEPSAGSGAFSDKLRDRNLISLDIDPESNYIIKQDWLTFEFKNKFSKILVVGNPPFGNQGGMALKFIKKSIDLGANTIAFILPKSFKKDSIKNKIPLNYHLEYEVDLDDDSFTLNDIVYNVPCVFQVWVKHESDREVKILKDKTHLFTFVKKEEDHDFAFRRVGFYAGRIYLDTKDKSIQSHYFIKSNIDPTDLICKIKLIEWEHNNTSGPRSIGKKELIERIEMIF